MLDTLITSLRATIGILQKQDIQQAARSLGARVPFLGSKEPDQVIHLGDDCAAIPDGDGYLLLAAEGIVPFLLDTEPWFAAWCSVLVNVSDIYAMGGRAIAVVDTIWSTSPQVTQPMWEGMLAASRAFNVPIVGGHTNCHSPYNALSVAILGRANHLITSFNARPGDVLMVVIDFRGQSHELYPFWDAATQAPPQRLQADLDLLPTLAEAGLCDAGKDISMGGIIGTALMLIEASGCGAVLDLDQVPCPSQVPLEKWLMSFPSYGFLLSVRPERVTQVQQHFQQRDIVCEPIGTVEPGSQLWLVWQDETALFWDVDAEALTGFSIMPSSPTNGSGRG
ncbi:MAG: sll0787 family AIR synthase-like protein [Elainellaceae cyanobacterium]